MTIFIHDHVGQQERCRPSTDALRQLYEDLGLAGRSVRCINGPKEIQGAGPALIVVHPSPDFRKDFCVPKALEYAKNAPNSYVLLVSSEPEQFGNWTGLPRNFRCSRLSYYEVTAAHVTELEGGILSGNWPEDSPLFSSRHIEAAIALYLLFAAEKDPSYERNPQLFENARSGIASYMGAPPDAHQLTQATLRSALAVVFASDAGLSSK